MNMDPSDLIRIIFDTSLHWPEGTSGLKLYCILLLQSNRQNSQVLVHQTINYLLFRGSRYTTDGAGDDMLSNGAIPEDGVYAGIIFVIFL
jgi:hypothetical protein